MATYKRWKGKKITPEDPHWKDARWTVEFNLNGRRVLKSIPEARTQAQAERAQSRLREDIYQQRYGGGKEIGFRDFFKESYLPWVAENLPASYRNAVSRGKELQKFFADQPLRQITRKDCEQLRSSLKKEKTPRGSLRSGATINRYMNLLSAICSRAIREGILSANPCANIDDDPEKGRERYLTQDEQVRLVAAMNDDLGFLRVPVLLSLHTGLRKLIELLQLKIAHVNFSARPVFFPLRGGSVEVPPNWLIVLKGKGSKYRLIPMNSQVRALLQDVVSDRLPEEFVFSKNSNDVNDYSLRWGFEEACKRAEIAYGETNAGGLIWHDLRRTFATRLRANGVHEYDIQDLLGHAKPGVTKVYARATWSVLERAVETLTEPWGQVVEFERRAG